MAIGLSHGGTNVYSSKERARQLWVATKDGLVLYERVDGGKWRDAKRALRVPPFPAVHALIKD